MTLGSRIRSARKRKGLSQAELGARCGGVSYQAVSQWERGVDRPDINRIDCIARELDVTADWLLGGDGVSIPENKSGSEEIRGRVVPQIQWEEIAKHGLERASPSGRVRTTFPCGPRSFQVMIEDRANEVPTSDSLNQGDAAVVDPDATPAPGDMVLVRVNGGLHLRQAHFGSHDVVLVPLNSQWPTYTVPSLSSDVLIGVVIETTRPRRL